MAHLRDLNRDFVTLCSQIVRIKDTNKPRRSGHSILPDAERTITDFKAIQSASEQIYNALGKACTVHTTHSAQLCLEAKRLTPDKAQIRFDMAFNHLVLSGSAMSSDLIWFSIESISSDSVASGPTMIHNPLWRSPDNTLAELSKTLKRQEEGPPPLNTKKLKVTKSVTCTTWGSSRDYVMAPKQESRSKSTLNPDPLLPDLCIRSNFCVQVRKCSDQSRNDRNVCIGVLERTSNCQHVVYLSPLIATNYVKKAISLAQLISPTSKKNQVGSLPQYEKLRLAILLSIGILQLQETSWLSRGWRSQDVVFFNAGDINAGGTGPLQKSALMTPYLNVPVTSAQNRQSIRPLASSAKSCLAPNALLYSLGIVLLELAYEAPLHSMQQPCDLEGGEGSRSIEFLAARRLSKTLGSVLGSTYGQIVRKCLSCDFGCGDDLSAPALQVEFYRDVVCELQRLEEGFSKLQLGPWKPSIGFPRHCQSIGRRSQRSFVRALSGVEALVRTTHLVPGTPRQTTDCYSTNSRPIFSYLERGSTPTEICTLWYGQILLCNTLRSIVEPRGGHQSKRPRPPPPDSKRNTVYPMGQLPPRPTREP